MKDFEIMGKFLETIDFNDFQLSECEKVIDSKKFLQNCLDVLRSCKSEKIFKTHYRRLEKIYDNFKSVQNQIKVEK